ncbi:stress responsive A/B barrel domain protein [Mycena crocata]|nr:stress responsive A/B barrel domain protein [Mycena crocata]
MAIVHIVAFKFASTAQATTIADACHRMLELKEKCLLPGTGEPYIMNSSGGKNSSPEGKSDGLTHAFVVIFNSEEDRKYYLEEDPAHQEFVKSLDGIVEKATIVDYEPNEF